QLALWGLRVDGRADLGDGPLLLVAGASEVRYRDLLARWHQLCDAFGPLPPPRVVNVDHGAQRFLLFALDRPRPGACVAPAMAWVDVPASGATVARGGTLAVAGWAFKDGVGIARVEVLLDGRVVAEARYGRAAPGVRAFWKLSDDPQHPRVGFDARVDLRGVAPGRHWLGLRLHGRDGSAEDWSEQPLDVR
ncbi:MAG: Ig-like domain-containing protein, partial [Lysobacteraceae bacterium]